MANLNNQLSMSGPGFLLPSRIDEWGRNYSGQRGGQDVWQNTPESFAAMSEAAGFAGMPAVYSGMMDSRDMIGGGMISPTGEPIGPIDPITGNPYSGGSVGLQRRRELADYFTNNPGSREWWESNFAEPTTQMQSGPTGFSREEVIPGGDFSSFGNAVGEMPKPGFDYAGNPFPVADTINNPVNPYTQMETAPGAYNPAYSDQGMELAGFLSPW